MAEIEKLVVSLEARINQFEKALAKANATANKQMTAVESRFAKANANIAKFGNQAFGGFARGAIGILAPLVTATAAINQAKAALEQFGTIADQSAAAGVDSEFFQGLAYQAKLSGVEIGGVASALATFAKNSGLAAEGKGKMVSALTALNPLLLANIQAATTQEQRIRLAATAINEAKSAAEAAALATTLFGESGTKLVAAFKGGADELDRMLVKAKEMGLIVERDLINRADELGDKLDTASQIVDLKLKQAFVNLAPLMVDAAGWAAEFARLLSIAYDQVKGIEDRQFLRPLQNELAGVYSEMAPLKDEITDLQARLAGEGGQHWQIEFSIGEAQAKLATLEAQAMRLLDRVTALQGRPTSPTIAGAAPSAHSPNLLGDAGLSLLDLPDVGEIDGVATSIRGVADAGADTAVEINRVTASLEPLTDGMEQFADVAQSATRGFIDDLIAGRSAAEALANVLGQLGDKLIDMGLGAIFGSGSSNFGALGQLFGLPGHASGTANTGGVRGQARGIVHGQEAVIPLPSGGKIPVSIRMPTAMRSSANASPSVPIVINIDATGADSAGLARVRQEIAGLKAELPGRIKHVVSRRGKDWI